MTELTTVQMGFFAVACLLAGLSKGGLGGPLPVALIVPLLSQVLEPRVVVPLITPFLIVADWFALYLYWDKWDMHYIRLLLPSMIVGVIMGGLLLSVIPTFALKIIIVVFTLLVIAYKLLADRLDNVEYTPRNWHAYLAGWSSAFASSLANAGAPTFVIYMMLQKVSPIVFVGTATLLFAVVNMAKIPVFLQQGLLDMRLVFNVAWAFPIIPLGVWLGRKSLDIIDTVTFERILMALLIVNIVLLVVVR